MLNYDRGLSSSFPLGIRRLRDLASVHYQYGRRVGLAGLRAGAPLVGRLAARMQLSKRKIGLVILSMGGERLAACRS